MVGNKKQIINAPSSLEANGKMLSNETSKCVRPSKIPVLGKNWLKKNGGPSVKPNQRKTCNQSSKIPVRLRKVHQNKCVSQNIVVTRRQIQRECCNLNLRKIPGKKRSALRAVNIDAPPENDNVTERDNPMVTSNNGCIHQQHQKPNSQTEIGQYSAAETNNDVLKSSNMSNADIKESQCQISPNRNILFKHYIENWRVLVELNEKSYGIENLDAPISTSEHHMLNEANSQEFSDDFAPICRPHIAMIPELHDFENIEQEFYGYPSWHDIYLAINGRKPNYLQPDVSQRLVDEDEFEEENVSQEMVCLPDFNFVTIISNNPRAVSFGVICAIILPTLFIGYSFYRNS